MDAPDIICVIQWKSQCYVVRSFELRALPLCSSTCEKESEKHPMFLCWNITLRQQLILLEFVKSLRTGDFNLYIQSLVLIVPWVFCLDHYHYARWLPIHINTMLNLNLTHPDIAAEFQSGKFTIQKSNRKFSRIALNHNHEQLNAKVKGVGGAIGLTQNESALQRWVICGPETSRLIDEFESLYAIDSENVQEHHDSSKCSQARFLKDLINMNQELEELGNPFLDDGSELYALDTKKVANNDAALLVIESSGKEQYKE